MKKLIILINIFIIIFLITGCSKTKTMTCTGISEGEQRTTNEKYVMKYKDGEMISAVLTTTHKFNNEDDMNIFVKALSSYVESLRDVAKEADDYMSVSSKTYKDNSYIIEVKADIEHLSDVQLESISMVRSIDDIKDILENNGLTCK